MLACFFGLGFFCCWVFFFCFLAVVKALHGVSGRGECWVLLGAGADGAVMGLLEEGFGCSASAGRAGSGWDAGKRGGIFPVFQQR